MQLEVIGAALKVFKSKLLKPWYVKNFDFLDL